MKPLRRRHLRKGTEGFWQVLTGTNGRGTAAIRLRALGLCLTLGLLLVGCSGGTTTSDGDTAIQTHTAAPPEERGHITQVEAENRIHPSSSTKGASAPGYALIAPWLEAFVASPVLEQRDTNTGTTMAVLGAISVLADQEANFFYTVCSLNLGEYLAGDERYKEYPHVVDAVRDAGLATYPSGWNGSQTSLVLAQASAFGLVDSDYYSHHCGDGNFEDPDAKRTEVSADTFKMYATRIMRNLNGELLCSNYDADKPNCQYTGSGKSWKKPDSLVDTLKSIIEAQKLAVISTIVYEDLDNMGLSQSFYPFSEEPDVDVPNVWSLGDDVEACRRNGQYSGKPCRLATHEMIAFGYIDHPSDPDQGLFVLRNSWGQDLGDNGNFYMTYGYAEQLLTTIAALTGPVGHTMHTNNVSLYFADFGQKGPDLMDLSGVRLTGFELLDDLVTDKQAPDGSDTVYCDNDSNTLPCECKEGKDAGKGGSDGNCGFVQRDGRVAGTLSFHCGRSKTDDPGTWFMNHGKNIPLPTLLPSEESFFKEKGIYPSEVNFAFNARLTFSVPNPDPEGDTTYISCQDMLFAQSSGKKISGQGFALTLSSDTVSIAHDATKLYLDPADVKEWAGLALDVGGLIKDILEFIFGHHNYWFLASSGSAGFHFAESAGGDLTPSLTFKCPATNGSYYAVRVATEAIFNWSEKADTFAVHGIQILEEKWTEDTDVKCTNNKTSVTCDSDALPSLHPVAPSDLCEVSGNSYEDDDGTLWYGGNPGHSCDETCAQQQLSCDLDKTVSIGSGGSDTDCRDMLKNLGSADHDLIRYTGGNDPSGCGQVEPNDPTHPGKFVVDADPPTTCEASHDTRCRACACQPS